MQATYSV